MPFRGAFGRQFFDQQRGGAAGAFGRRVFRLAEQPAAFLVLGEIRAVVAVFDEAFAVPAMLQAQQQILAPLTERQRTEFMRLMRIVVDENNALSRAPSEAAK